MIRSALAGAEVLITGWGCPHIGEDILAAVLVAAHGTGGAGFLPELWGSTSRTGKRQVNARTAADGGGSRRARRRRRPTA